MIAALVLVVAWLGQVPGAVRQEPRPPDLDLVRARLTGSFEAVERNDRGEATGHLIARASPGGFLARDYWSEADGRRIYAGHDVLELRDDGTASHWWFGSKGDFAEAHGDWDEEALVLVVRDEDGDAVRRYTYRFDRPEFAFRFHNEHASGRGWKPFMEADWRRAEATLPADLRGTLRPGADGIFSHYSGRLLAGETESRGRVLFEEWLVLDQPSFGHGVMSTGWFGKVELWWWDADGSVLRFAGKQRDRQLLLEARGPGGELLQRRRDELLPNGFQTSLEDPAGRPLAPPRHWLRDAAHAQ